MTDTNEKIRQHQEEIDDAELKIKDLKVKIARVKERINKRNFILKYRTLSFRESGDPVNYMEVSLGAE